MGCLTSRRTFFYLINEWVMNSGTLLHKYVVFSYVLNTLLSVLLGGTYLRSRHHCLPSLIYTYDLMWTSSDHLFCVVKAIVVDKLGEVNPESETSSSMRTRYMSSYFAHLLMYFSYAPWSCSQVTGQ